MKLLIFLVCLLISFTTYSKEHIYPYTYLSLDKKCEVFKYPKKFTKCSNSKITSPFTYDFKEHNIVATYNKQKFTLNYGERLDLINDRVVILKSDQLIRFNELITVRNDEYVDYCSNDYKILNEFEFCLNENIERYNELTQSEYYQILYYELSGFTQLIKKYLVLMPEDLSPLLEANVEKQKLILIFSHHREKMRLLNLKYPYYKFYLKTQRYYESMINKVTFSRH